MIALGWAFALTHHGDEALHCIQEVRRALTAAAPTELNADRAAEVGLIEACMTAFLDYASGLDDRVAAVINRRESMNGWALVAAANIAGWIALKRFDFPAALRWTEWSEALPPLRGRLVRPDLLPHGGRDGPP